MLIKALRTRYAQHLSFYVFFQTNISVVIDLQSHWILMPAVAPRLRLGQFVKIITFHNKQYSNQVAWSDWSIFS